MNLRVRSVVMVVACVLLLGVVTFAVACGGADETTTTAMASETTAQAPDETPGAGIQVKGLVDGPATLAASDLEALNVSTITAEHPKLGPTEYTGVLFSDLMAALGVQSGAVTVMIAAGDGYMAEIPLADLSADAMLAFGDDGTYDCVFPSLEGKSWVSDVASMEFK